MEDASFFTCAVNLMFLSSICFTAQRSVLFWWMCSVSVL